MVTYPVQCCFLDRKCTSDIAEVLFRDKSNTSFPQILAVTLFTAFTPQCSASHTKLWALLLNFKNRASYIQDGCTATLQMLHSIYFFSTNIGTEYFKHAAHSPFFSSKFLLFHNATFFGSCIIRILHTGCVKI